jgi:hypothetical protein
VWWLLAGLVLVGLVIIGCSIDDALDLVPGAVGAIDVIGGGKEGCSVYNGDSYRYIGYLTLPAPHAGQVLIRQSLHPDITNRACESIR